MRIPLLVSLLLLLALTAQAQVPNCGCLDGWQYFACLIGAYIDCSGADPGIPGVPPRIESKARIVGEYSPIVLAKFDRPDLDFSRPVVLEFQDHGPVMPPPCPDTPPDACSCLSGFSFVSCLLTGSPNCNSPNSDPPTPPGPPLPPPGNPTPGTPPTGRGK